MQENVGYARLSHEDGDEVSVSIENQKAIITKFAEDNGIKLSRIYVDDGYSGYTMNRPAFNELKEGLNSGKINTIIIKDLSRLSRHNAQAQFFLEKIMETGNRILSIHEGYDTYDPRTHDMAGVYTWLNEKHVRDTSIKVKTAIHSMQKEGKVVSSLPYGYIRHPYKKNKYSIDESCAKYVKEIFDMYINGMGVKAIAIELSKRGVPTLKMLHKQRAERTGKPYSGKVNTIWYSDTIQKMLLNRFYAGDLVLHKTKRKTIKGKKAFVPEDEQYVFPNAHDPIVDRQTFDLAQEIYAKRRSEGYQGVKIKQRPNIFSGMLYCADCGKRLTSSSSGMNTRYVCRTYNKVGTDFCTNHAILESDLKENVIDYLQSCRGKLSKLLESVDFVISKELKRNGTNTTEVLKRDLERVKNELKVLMEQKMRDSMKNPEMIDMIDEMYVGVMNEKYEMIRSIELQIKDALAVPEHVEIQKSFKSIINLFDEIIMKNDINKKQIQLLIEKITVYDDGSTDIYLKGDLHELCGNKINVKQDLWAIVDQYIAEYIIKNENRITPTGAWKYATEKKNIKVGRRKHFNFFQKYINDKIIVPIEGIQWYKLNISKEELLLYAGVQTNNVAKTVDRRDYSNVTISLIFKWIDFGRSLSPSKKLF